MPMLSGPELDEVRDAAIKWYYTMRQFLIEKLESGHPFGAVHLTPAEQFQNFIQMAPEDWSALIAQLTNRYRGLPNTQELVNADLANYTRKMLSYGNRAGMS